MDKPGEKDCKIIDGGLWISKDFIELMSCIYEGKARPPQKTMPLSYYEGKRDLMLDLLSFIDENN